MASMSNDGLLPPLVVRNKRGRKVDETLPKSHQREVQRQFRARRAGHLIDLERRVSLLERENMVLRHWAGVLPATRSLLGRGPTGCDTTKPLIAEENDDEIQLVMDENSPRERNWPETPTARTSFVMEPQHGHQQQQQQQHHMTDATLPSAPNPHSHSSISSQIVAQLGSGQYEKPQGGYEHAYPELQRFKPHPLYDHRPLEIPMHVQHIPQPPAPQPQFDHNSSALGATGPANDRLLIKRESVYATPNPNSASLLPQQNSTPSLPPQQQPSLNHGAGYYTVPHRPSYPQRVDRFSNMEQSQSMYAQQSPWADSYLQHNSTAPVSQQQQGNRRPPHPTLMTPVLPSAGPSSGSVASSSPGSQSANADPRSNGAGVNGSVSASTDPAFVHHGGHSHTQSRSVSYAIGVNGSAVNLSTLNNNGSQTNLASLNGNSNGTGLSSSGYMPPPGSAQFGSYHIESENDSFRQ